MKQNECLSIVLTKTKYYGLATKPSTQGTHGNTGTESPEKLIGDKQTEKRLMELEGTPKS